MSSVAVFEAAIWVNKKPVYMINIMIVNQKRENMEIKEVV